MDSLNREVRRTFNRWYSQMLDEDTAQILTARDLDLCLGTVRQALADPNFTPQAGVCPLPNSHA